ncbi:MAG: beta-glucosidase [Ruminococcaceae bacterium]|nr:beta-glucosidase [Oscillospiraceae bacterium]
MPNEINLEKLLSQMTVDEKIGQLVQTNGIFFLKDDTELTGPASELEIDLDYRKNIGSLLNFKNAENAINIQEKYLRENRNGIPMIFASDTIHGCYTIYPIPLALGASFNPELVEECCAMAAKEAAADGIHLTFSPMVDLSRDARWGRVMEGFGEDSYYTGVMAAAQIRGYKGKGLSNKESIATCAKHFAAYGAGEGGRDYNLADMSEHSLREYFLPAYKACVDAGVDMIMPSFNSVCGIPATANKHLLCDILRDEWEFDGVVNSDYSAIKELVTHGVAKNFKDAARLAFESQCDIDMISPCYAGYLKKLIEEGVFTEEELDRSVMRVLKLKKELGLFEDPYHGADPERVAELELCDEHREIARRAAEESAVLLKNDGVLPFSKDVKKIVLLGPFADSHSILSWWRCRGKKEKTVTMEEGVRNLLKDAEVIAFNVCSCDYNDKDLSNISKAVELAKNADAAIICVGESSQYSGEANSRTDITLSLAQRTLVKEVSDAQKNSAVLLFGGRPLVLTEENECAHAILNMYLPGHEGGNAAARLLFGEVSPSGKVSMSFPRSVGQCPIYYNRMQTNRPPRKDYLDIPSPHNFTSAYLDCGTSPLFTFGYGLSYTTFRYDSMTLDKTQISKDEKITVSVTITNTGNVEAKEVVQLYLHDLVASIVRPIQEFKAFQKISLKPNETQTVKFEIAEPMLRFWNAKNEFVSESGEFTVSVGYADHFTFTEKFELL